MTENEWNTCRDPVDMLSALADDSYKSLLRLFGCACCRRVWNLLSDERLQQGVEVRERYERGLATEEMVKESASYAGIARSEIRFQFKFVHGFDEHSIEAAPAWAAGAASNAASGNYHAASDLSAVANACADGGDWQTNYEIEKAKLCDLLRSMVSKPFR